MPNFTTFHQGVLWAAVNSHDRIIIIGKHTKTIGCLATSLLDTQISDSCDNLILTERDETITVNVVGLRDEV